MNPMRMCPDSATLAAYLDDRLDEPARQAVQAHLAVCSDCCDLVIESAETLEQAFGATGPVERETKTTAADVVSIDQHTSSRGTGWRWSFAAAALAAVVAVALWTPPRWWQGLVQTPAERRMAALVDAVGERRFVEARIMGGFEYGPMRTTNRGLGPGVDDLPLVAAAAALQQAADAEPTAETLRGVGVAYLAIGEIDRGVAALEDAARRAPSHAGVLSDLSAALLARAASGDRLDAAAAALDAAERALQIDPDLLEAQFNRALALERAGLRDQARDAWRRYLERDAGSPWRQDAEKRLKALDDRSGSVCPSNGLENAPWNDSGAVESWTRRCPQQAREYVERYLLPQWAQLANAGDGGAADVLARAARASAALERVTGDGLPAISVRAIANASARERTALADGHAALQSGLAAYERDDRVAAARDLSRASALLRAAGSPMWLWAETHLANFDWHRRDLAAAIARLDLVRRAGEAGGYLSLLAREAWLRGAVALEQSRPADALAAYGESLAYYQGLGESANAAAVSSASADTERQLGLLRRGWGSLGNALTQLDAVEPTRRYLMYYNASLFAARAGLHESALLYQQQALVEAGKRSGGGAAAEATIALARLLLERGRWAEASAAFTEAERLIAGLRSPEQAQYMRARLALATAELDTTRSTAARHEAAAAALAFFERVEPAEVPRIRLIEGMLLRAEAAPSDAARAFELGIAAFERRFAQLRDPALQISFFDESWALFENLIAVQLDERQPEAALETAERAHTLSLGLARPGASRESQPLHERVATSVDEGTAIVVYAWAGQRLHWWLLGRRGWRSGAASLDNTALADTLRRLERLVARRSRSPEVVATLETLYDAIVEPLPLEGITRLVIVPEGGLASVPFCALRNRRTGRYLVEEVEITQSPGVHAYLDRLGPLAEHPLRAAVFGASGRGVESLGLSPLAHAPEEARDVASEYPAATLVTGDKLSRDAMAHALDRADVVHFAGHALVNEEFPWMSALVLGAARDGAPELVYAYELERLGLTRAQVVVLAACDTARGASRRGDGVVSIARPLLAGGVRSVVASLWRLDDRASRLLLGRFHRELARQRRAGAALRAAQLTSIAETGRGVEFLADWAGLVTIGV